jgi:hypothetical protein
MPPFPATFCTFLQTFARFCPILHQEKSLKTGSISNNPFVCNTRSALGSGKLATKVLVNYLRSTITVSIGAAHSLSPPTLALVLSAGAPTCEGPLATDPMWRGADPRKRRRRFSLHWPPAPDRRLRLPLAPRPRSLAPALPVLLRLLS